MHTNNVKQLQLRSGGFLHYIVNNLGPVRQQYVHPLEQHPQGFWRGGDYSQPDGCIFRRQQDIQGSHLPHLLKELSRRGAEPSRLHPLLKRSPHGQGQKTDQDMGLGPVLSLMVDWSHAEIRLFGPEGVFHFGQLNVARPDSLRIGLLPVGAQEIVAAL